MCLENVTSTTRERHRKGVGWKIFTVRNGKLYSEFWGSCSSRARRVWLKSKDNGTKSYPLGFHIFFTRAEARRWKALDWEYCRNHRVMKVKFRDVLAEGNQSGLRVIVAKEMLIY